MNRIHSKWWKRILTFLLSVMILGCLTILSIDAYVKQTVQAQIISREEAGMLEDVDCILVLGCGVRGKTPSPMLSDRLKTGITLYELQAADKLLMSGDHGREDYDEVNVMKQYAIDADIPSDDVFMDHAGFSTYESIYRASKIFCAKKVIVVTQGYHLPRALFVAKALGMDAYGVAADTRSYPGQAFRDFRELLARNKDFFYTLALFQPETFGEVIPVSGDGNITNDQ